MALVPVHHLVGHRGPVLCIAGVTPSIDGSQGDSVSILATGGSDGTARMFDLRDPGSAAGSDGPTGSRAVRCFMCDPNSSDVTCVVMGDMFSRDDTSEEGRSPVQEDAQFRAWCPPSDVALWASVGTSVLCFDVRAGDTAAVVLQKEPQWAWHDVVEDEINSLDVRSALRGFATQSGSTSSASATVDDTSRFPAHLGRFVVAGSDTGEVVVLDSTSAPRHGAATATARREGVFRTLAGAHTNICSSVVLHPWRPWEMYSGGLDSRIVQWRIDKSLVKARLDMSTATPGNGPSSGGSRKEQRQRARRRGKGAIPNAAAETPPQSAPQVNPPLCYSVSVDPSGNLMAAGLGDGSVALFDISRAGPPQLASRESSIHMNGVASVAFMENTGKECLLLSGGIDRKIVAWETAGEKNAGSSSKRATVGAPTLTHSVTYQHDSKIQWMAAIPGTNSVGVADDTAVAKVFVVRE